MKRVYIIRYNNGTYASTLTFVDKSDEEIEKRIVEEIERLNINVGDGMPVTRENVRQIQ